MPHQPLDGVEIHAGFQGRGGKGMPERFDIMLHLIDKH
jgi:hypothetical protein